jgi:putative copper resistance protein D
VNDLHEGGAVMWIGGAAIMFAVIMVTFFEWTRETRPSAGMGWLETARRSSLAERIAETGPAGTAGDQARDRVAKGSARLVDVDADDDQLAAYNAYLARINLGAHESESAD